MAKKRAFSMRPEEGEEGGLPLSNDDIRITSAVCTTFGAGDAPERMMAGGREADDPCAKIEFEYINESEDAGDPEPLFLSAGKANRLVPSEDGEEPAESGPFFIPAEESKARGLNKNSNLWQFYNSLAKPEAGKLKFDTSLLDEKGIEALVGLELHVRRAPSKNQPEPGSGERERTIVIVSEILSLGKGKAAKAKAKKAKDEDEDEADADTDSDADPIDEEAEAIVVKALKKAGDDGIEKDALTKKVFVEVAKSKNKKSILAKLGDDEWLGDDARPWEYDTDSETLTQAA